MPAKSTIAGLYAELRMRGFDVHVVDDTLCVNLGGAHALNVQRDRGYHLATEVDGRIGRKLGCIEDLFDAAMFVAAYAQRAGVVPAPVPMNVDAAARAEDAAHDAWNACRKAHHQAVVRDMPRAVIDEHQAAMDRARDRFADARAARWVVIDAEHAIEVGRAPPPRTASDASMRAILDYLETHLAHERAKAPRDRARTQALIVARRVVRAAMRARNAPPPATVPPTPTPKPKARRAR